MRYRFTGHAEEDFPAPPIARRLQPGDIVEVPEPVEHARLELIDERGERVRDPFEDAQAKFEANPDEFARQAEAKKSRTRKTTAEQPPANTPEE